MKEVVCPYCDQPAELVGGDVIYPHRHDLAHKKFWLCRPCNAYVGCHAHGDGSHPLGRLANAELRAAKQSVHRVFDPLWQDAPSNGMRRRAYRWLAGHLGMNVKHCHIGHFDVETCNRAAQICRELGTEFR